MGTTLIIIALSWLLLVGAIWVVVIPALRRGPRSRADTGLLWILCRAIAYVWHRLHVAGREYLPADDDDHEGLIVVANHTGSVDPLLIQAPCRFWIRWMMADDMMTDGLAWLWTSQELIPVDRLNPDMGSLRTAIRHVKDGGAIGIFPEGRITTPPREVRPFLPGVGLLVSRTRAPVLLVWVSGTPDTNDMHESLCTRSHSRVEFLGLYRFEDEKPDVITQRLREIIHERSGWPYNDAIQPVGGPAAEAAPA